MPAHPETTRMLKAVLGLRLDTDRLLPFLRSFYEKGYNHITLYDLVDITIRKVGITSEDISRLRDTADLHPEMKKAEFARYLKVSRQTIYNWMADGLLILTSDHTRIRTRDTALLWELLLHLIGQN